MKTASSPRVAIAILIWNGKEDTLKCLRSLREDTYPNKEIIIVDNGSTDDSVAEIHRSFPEVVVLEMGTNLGFTGGNNAGIRHAISEGFDYVYMLNNDTTVEPDALERLVEAAQGNPGAGLVAPVIHDLDPPRAIWFAGSAISLRHGEAWHDNSRQPERTEPPYEVPWATGCAMLLRAGLLGELGGFDDRYFLSWEDVDLSLRVREAGQTVMVAPMARIYHKGGQSGKNFNGIYSYYAVRNRLLLASKHSGRDYPRALVWIISRHLKRCLHPRFTGPRVHQLLLIWQAVRDHFRHQYGQYRAAS